MNKEVPTFASDRFCPLVALYFEGRVESWRGGLSGSVSNSRLFKRSMRISRTTLSCTLLVEGYERHLRRLLTDYFNYYHRSRTHLLLDKDAPETRPVELPEIGAIRAVPQVGGLHHRYTRRAA